jgi:glycine/D-amino acid oxidase-like deaminating enzyme
MLDPAHLAWGLARACREKGVRIHEGTPATALRRAGSGVVLDTPAGEMRARQVMLASNAFPAMLKNVCLDLLAGEQTERTSLPIVGSKPVPWPPEPLRAGVIAMTQRSMHKAQDNGGEPDMWLRTLEKFMLGFDS